MSDSKWIRWWRYPSVWKFWGILLGAVVLSLLSILFIPEYWNIGVMVVILLISGHFGRKFGMESITDIFNKEIMNEE